MVTLVLKHVGLIIYYMIMILCLHFVGLITENKLYIVKNLMGSSKHVKVCIFEDIECLTPSVRQ